MEPPGQASVCFTSACIWGYTQDALIGAPKTPATESYSCNRAVAGCVYPGIHAGRAYWSPQDALDVCARRARTSRFTTS
jgi:hypothetical protein